MVVYKIWLSIERISERDDTYEDIDEPLELGVYTNKRAAKRAAVKLHQANWPDCYGPECRGKRKSCE